MSGRRSITETPALAPYAQAFQGSDSVLKFVAVDPKVQDDFATNLNVIVEELSADATLDDYEAGVHLAARELCRTWSERSTGNASSSPQDRH